jgi:hypothetical protein
MFVEIAASKELTHSEKLITAYLFTLFLNDKIFFGTNAYLSEKLDVQKSAISVCLQKLVRMGWITITNPKSNKRKVTMLHNPCTSKLFYRLYYIVAESKALTALEKILISYILSFTDNGNRFYAKNAMVENILDISKEGFNTSRIKFEQFGWIKVMYPKSPRRELIVINHPKNNMVGLKQPVDINVEVTKLMELNKLKKNSELPNNTHTLPVNNDNYISNKINNKRNVIIEVNNEIDSNTNLSFSSVNKSNSFLSDMVEEQTSTKDASPEACTSTIVENNDEEHTSTNEEAHASTKHEAETSSTISEAYASIKLDEEHASTELVTSASSTNIDDGGTDRKAESVDNQKLVNVLLHLGIDKYKNLRNMIYNYLSKEGLNNMQIEKEIDESICNLTTEEIESCVS